MGTMMEHTTENVVKVLEARVRHLEYLIENGCDSAQINGFFGGEITGIEAAINILTDTAYFQAEAIAYDVDISDC